MNFWTGLIIGAVIGGTLATWMFIPIIDRIDQIEAFNLLLRSRLREIEQKLHELVPSR